jgi:hypothetical protein
MIEIVPGSKNVEEVLEHDPVFKLIGMHLANPAVLGVVLFLIVVAIVLFGPASESRFIYTDF